MTKGLRSVVTFALTLCEAIRASFSPRSRNAGLAAVIFTILALAAASLSLFASVLLRQDSSRALPKGFHIPLPIAAMITVLCVGLFWFRRDTAWARALTGEGEGPRIARRLAPIALIPFAIAMIVELSFRQAGYGPDLSLLVVTELTCVGALVFVLWTARRLGRERLENQSLSRTLGLPPVLALAHALDLTPVIVRSLDGQIEHWPRGCETLYGWSASEALGAMSHELLQTQFPQPLQEIEAVLARDGQWTGELSQITRQGVRRRIAARWVLQDRGPTAPARVVESLGDITELAAAAEALRDSKDRLTHAVSAFGLGILDYDPLADRCTFSHEMEDILGARAGFLGSTLDTWRTRFTPEEYERGTRVVTEDVATGISHRRCDTKIRRLDGEVRNLEGVRRYRYADDGSCNRIITIYMDVTERIRDRLEMEARGVRLMEVQADLAHVSRLSAMGEMAAALAHELNQPLTAVGNSVGAIGLMIDRTDKPLDGVVRERILKAAQQAEAQAVRAGEIVRRLRGFISRGEADMRVENLPHLIDESVALAAPNPQAANIDLRQELSPAAGLVLADRVQIQQILVNLIRNASEAMRGQAAPCVLTISTELEGEMVLVRVADSGPGVAPEVADRLFSPFMTTKSNGMGVGLSICRRIVEAHGGTMWLEPGDPTAGADFRFTLPHITTEA